VYAGFVTTKRVVKKIGIHQKFDTAAYRMIFPYLDRSLFPTLNQILHFEGINGPDGIKVKSLGHHDPSHMYDPVTDSGVLPELLASHYNGLVAALAKNDRVRASFEAAWLAHYLVDGLTPAHHYPYDAKKEELFGCDSEVGSLRKHWHWLGGKGVLSTHVNFEMGVAATLLLYPIRCQLDDTELALARQMGPINYFKYMAKEMAEFNIYEKFYVKGWNVEMARSVRQVVAPLAARTVGIVWLLAYLEAGLQAVLQEASLTGKQL
jgi:hypothetical protein